MKNMFEGVSKLMKKVEEQAIRFIFVDRNSRAITGIIMVGLGAGLIASAYVKLPN